MDRNHLGRRIREERLNLRMTQEQLAEAINVSPTYIGLIERGERSVTLEKLMLIAKSLHASIDYLLQDNLDFSSGSNEKELKLLWAQASPKEQNLILDIMKAILNYRKDS